MMVPLMEVTVDRPLEYLVMQVVAVVLDLLQQVVVRRLVEALQEPVLEIVRLTAMLNQEVLE